MKAIIYLFLGINLVAAPVAAQELTKSSNFVIETPTISNGSGQTSSNNYTTRGILGSTSDGSLNSDNYSLEANEPGTRQADVLPKPTWENDSDWVDRLHLIIDRQNNAPDTKYAIAISNDDFSTAWFVQSDLTIGQTLGNEDWLTYADLGRSAGTYVLGLSENTSYKVKAAATHGSYSATRYSATSDAASTRSSYLRLASDRDSCSLGQLSPELTGSCAYQLTLATNYSLGAYITVLGATLTTGGNSINAIGTSATKAQPGVEQFGFNLVANTQPTIGTDPSGTSMTASAEFATSNNFAFEPGREVTILTKNARIESATNTVSWIANVSSATTPGQYQTTITHTAYAQ